MCGIAGLVSWRDGRAADRLAGMIGTLVHRGPDDSGCAAKDGVYLGHRRLAVIDLSQKGRQPMTNEDGSVWLTYNGELYGTEPLREWLESRGHRFLSRTDTEVFVHLYEEEGVRLFPRVNGMFAFAIHDRRRGRLLLARDRLGIKPLFYAWADGELIFALEMKAVLAGLGRVPSLRPDVLGQYILQGYASAPDTVYHGVRALPPGHFLDVDLGELKAGGCPEPSEYWDAAFTGDDDRSREEIEAELEGLLSDAVRIAMVADVPLGAFLSGGLDSSTVVAFMARATSAPVRTFTVDVPGSHRSEGAKALLVARKYETAHVQVDAHDAVADQYWQRLAHFDAPFNCASLLSAWLVSRAAREHVTVALSGDGGDELFGGYDRYLGGPQRRRPALARALLRTATTSLPHDLRGRARLASFVNDDFVKVFTANHPVPVEAAEALVGTSIQPWVSRMRATYERYRADHATRAMYLDLKTYLPDHILAKVDSASMSVSLEVRVPLLDHRLVEMAGRVPSSLKVRNGIGKWLFRRMSERWLPAGLADQAKVGFDPPLSSWAFTADLARRLAELAEPQARFRSVLDGRLVDRWIRDLSVGSPWRVPRRAALWAIYQLERWMQMQEAAT